MLTWLRKASGLIWKLPNCAQLWLEKCPNWLGSGTYVCEIKGASSSSPSWSFEVSLRRKVTGLAKVRRTTKGFREVHPVFIGTAVLLAWLPRLPRNSQPWNEKRRQKILCGQEILNTPQRQAVWFLLSLLNATKWNNSQWLCLQLQLRGEKLACVKHQPVLNSR